MNPRDSSSNILQTQMEIDANLCDQGHHNHSHLPSAYIRSLVKQLTSSRTTQNTEDSSLFGEEMNQNNNHPQPQQLQQQEQQKQQHKKQVRRRLHTTRPYQERLVNMAEARREIVTALKFHRAAMKQQAEQKQQQQRQPQNLSTPIAPPQFQQDFGEFPKFGSVNCPLSYTSFTYQPPPVHLNWPVSPISPLPAVDILNSVLPNQPLGLNLNLQDFENINTTLYRNCNPWSSIYSTDSSPSSSSNANPQSDSGSFSDGGAGKHHVVMDDEEMAEIRSIGERHQMEWNDNMSLATSAWWFNFLKEMDVGPHQVVEAEDGGNYQPFGQAVELEFPAWLNSADNCSQQHFDDCCLSQDYFQDTALPGKEIGEIEAMDEEWLS